MGKNKSVGCGCNYCMSRGYRRDFRHGAAGDGWEDTKHRKAGKKKQRKRKPGCPENDGGSHVYVWIDYNDWVWISGYEQKVCCGCGKRYGGRKGFRLKM